MIDDVARRAAETAARQSYGRLIAFLASRSRDVAAAEDALSEAFRVALDRWPRDGVPNRPEAWLLTVARREIGHSRRHEAVRLAAEPALMLAFDEARANAEGDSATDFPDERLKLLFVCAHPAIDPAARTPLMLQTVLGLDAARIASAFLVAPATMSQRLVRAKLKIRDARIRFEEPGRAEWSDRLEAVMEAVYGAYGVGWDATPGAGRDAKGLVDEAIWLGRTLVSLLPCEPETLGLLALMLYCEARAPARRDPHGRYVPLDLQDAQLWDGGMIAAAAAALVAAGSSNRFGRFQCEAAIQAVHAARASGAPVDRAALAMLYEALAQLHPTIGVLVSRAAARADIDGARRGLDLLDELPADRIKLYQPYWAVRAELLTRLGKSAEAGRAYDLAIGLSDDAAVKAFLRARASGSA